MAKYVDKDGWIEEVEETNEWSNEIQEEDDEETIRLKKRLAKAEEDLRVEKSKHPKENNIYNKGDASSKKKAFYKNAKTKEGILNKYITDEQTRIWIYIVVIILSIVAIALKFVI